jgi:hypothetical protein
MRAGARDWDWQFGTKFAGIVPLLPATDAGWDRVAPDGVSTKTVQAIPCSTAADETDGTTTCIGIPGSVPRDYTTIGGSSGR